MWDAKDWTWVSQIQDKIPTNFTPSLAPKGAIFERNCGQEKAFYVSPDVYHYSLTSFKSVILGPER